MTIHFNKITEKNKRRELRQRQTHTDEIVWPRIRNRKMLGLKFKRQYSIDKFVLDFYCSELKIAIEIDGSIHELEEINLYDIQRQKYIEGYGIIFIRITNKEISDNSELAFKNLENKIKNLKSPSPL